MTGPAALEGKGGAGAVACADVDGGVCGSCYAAAFGIWTAEEWATGVEAFQAWRAFVSSVRRRDETEGGPAGF